MRIVIYGGTFDPPHRGHRNAAAYCAGRLKADRMMIIPTYLPPHKSMPVGTPAPEQRLEMCRLAFEGIRNVEVSDIELRRGGKSFTSDTLRQIREENPEAELWLLVGVDMLLTLDTWHEAADILQHVKIGAFPRTPGQMKRMSEKAKALRAEYGAEIRLFPLKPLPASSTQIRRALRFRGGVHLLQGKVYAYIIRNRLYGAKVNFDWLRKRAYAMLKPRRIAHVQGCESEAIRLAERYGADPDKAAEAAILHDCTKKSLLDEQLLLCERYGITPDAVERVNGKLLHAKTGAAVAEQEFGMSPDVVGAIRWHTTGRAGMTLLEKIMYMADYVEPNRDFEGVEALRSLAYQDLDRAMLLGLEMSLEEIRGRGEEAHGDTLAAAEWFRRRLAGDDQ